MVAGEGGIDHIGQQCRSRLVGVKAVGQHFGMGEEGFVEVDEAGTGGCRHTFDGALNEFVPIARSGQKSVVTVGDGRHPCEEKACLGVGGAERVDQRDVVLREIIAEERPVARIGVVDTEVNHHDVGTEIECISVDFLRDVRAVSATQQGRAGVAEVAHVIALAEAFLQARRVALGVAVGEAVAVGDAVAHAGHAEGRLAFRSGASCAERACRSTHDESQGEEHERQCAEVSREDRVFFFHSVRFFYGGGSMRSWRRSAS